MKLHITPLNRRVLVTVDSSTEDRQECLPETQIWIQQYQSANNTHLDKDLTIEPVPSITGYTPPYLKRVRLEKYLPLTRKRRKCCLCGVQRTQSKLNSYDERDNFEFHSEADAYQIMLCFNGDCVTEFSQAYERIMKPYNCRRS
jgi:hypothetical protein